MHACARRRQLKFQTAEARLNVLKAESSKRGSLIDDCSSGLPFNWPKKYKNGKRRVSASTMGYPPLDIDYILSKKILKI